MTNATDPHREPFPPPDPSASIDEPVAPPPSAPDAPTTGFAPVPTTSPAPVAPSRREHSAWHVIAIVVGCLAILPSLGLLTGGIVVTVAQGVADDGYFDVTLDRVESDGVAVAAVDLWESAADDEDWPWILDWLDPDIRIDARGGASTDDVFVGIAPTGDVEAYLADASFDEVTDFRDREPVYASQAGDATVDPPTEQNFWVAEAAGPGEQRLDWEARNGNWSVVVMNADGSPGVAADVTVGVSSDAVLPIGIVLIVLGAIGVLGSVALIIVGARGRAAA